MKEKRRLLNDEIRANKIQLINDEWENLWEMSMDEAREKAKALELDLMEMWSKWDLSIIKILDYGKFLYRQKKQEQKSKQKWKAPDLKNIRITFKIWEHDLEVRKNQAIAFAKWWHPLKVSLMLKWRENQYENIASEKMNVFVNSLAEHYKLDWTIKKNWNTFLAMLKPIK